MIVLGIDTSGYVNAVGLADGTRVLADVAFPAKTDSLEQIVDNIDSVLKSAGLSLEDIQGIGVGLGPGSWTGIKVGVTVGKMLAFSADKPVAGIPTLEALAYAARKKSLFIYAVINSGVGDTVYAARYHTSKNGVSQEGEYFTGSIKDLVPLINEPVLLVGGDIKRYRDIILKENPLIRNKVKALEALPSGAAVACLAAVRLARGMKDNPLSLTPLYLKESTAEVFINKYKVK
ncbi:MAG: tRNA (adenosine(37)-N6)-threonylcarbamoyltransferase complex dimerization subunit type 1 TsaB [Dehalococcoidales bacterium]|nr:tRNA (adenosine(37)-N6)-threonylcarbamoyltransferase complex dimerization subunit type 1 TsaB [Dehalococcoidales bacterium]